MQSLEVSGAVRPIYGSLGVKRLTKVYVRIIDDDWFLFTPWCRCLEYNTWFLRQKKTIYSYARRLVLSHPHVVKYCMKRKCATLVFKFSFYVIFYRLRMSQYESKHVVATRSLINACLFTDLCT